MSLVAVVGDASTTTALALALCWPSGVEVLLAELDPSGGDLAGWLDVTEQPGVASAVAAAPTGSWPVVAEQVQTTPAGLRVLVAPLRAGEAMVAIREAATRLVPTLSALDAPVVVADCGRQHPNALSPVVTQAGLVVVGVRQPRTSARAAAVHLDRIGELIDALAARSIPTVAAVVGEEPYTATEIAGFLGGDTTPLTTVVLADDPTGAAMLAGRERLGRRAAKCRLLRSAAIAAAEVAVRLQAARSVPVVREVAR